ncbi:hypothetical protein HC031_25335 [Planosporangium thailandense]|uniref:Uncharacterized protein n=1 Tax=Planosporangium thailandense TaxID=765197 RepID=A0ABX0Y6T6_9ACTN|nr:hypothetical protein [Planosporangium thailandense]NJC73014.1 hypothetical protein [Planosporangium thailandense]
MDTFLVRREATEQNADAASEGQEVIAIDDMNEFLSAAIVGYNRDRAADRTVP